MKKKGIVFVMVFMMLFLTSCKNGETEISGSTPTELHIVYSSYSGIPEDLEIVQDALNKILIEKINCTVNLEVYPSSNYDTQINLLLSGGDGIDLMTSGLNTRYHQIVSKKLVLPIDDLLEKYGKGIMDAVGDSLEAGRINGILYGVTGVPLTAAADTGFAVKNKILNELDINLQEVKTIEDVEIVLKKIKEKYPDMTPLIPSSSGRAYDDLSNYMWRYDEMESIEDGCIVDYETMTVSNLYESETFKKTVELLYRWNKEGLIMPNASTNSDTRGALLDGNQGVAYLTTSYSPTLSAKENLQLDVDIVELNQNKILGTSSFTNTQWMIPVKSKHPEEAMKFLNLLYTDEEVGNMLQYGIEGVHYVKTDKENVITYPEGQDVVNSRYYVKTPGITDININCYAIEPLPGDIYQKYQEFKNEFKQSPLLGFMADVSECKTETAAIANAFIAGQVDAAAVWEPSLSMAQQETGGNILATSGDKEFEGLIPAILAVNGDSLKTKREEMKSVMKAWYSARDAYDKDPEKFAEAVAGGAEVTAEEFLELMKGCDVRTMEDNAEAFAAGDTYVSLPYCANMLAGFLQYNGLIDSMPDNFNDLFDSSLFEEVYEEMK